MNDYNPVENPWKWASENLSKPRAEAFKRAYRELERHRWSDTYLQFWRELQNIERAFISKQSEEIGAIYEQERAEVAEIENQIRELQNKAATIREQARERVSEIHLRVYSDPAYKAKNEQVKKAAMHSKVLFTPKVQALIDKYAAAQLASDTKSA